MLIICDHKLNFILTVICPQAHITLGFTIASQPALTSVKYLQVFLYVLSPNMMLTQKHKLLQRRYILRIEKHNLCFYDHYLHTRQHANFIIYHIICNIQLILHVCAHSFSMSMTLRYDFYWQSRDSTYRRSCLKLEGTVCSLAEI